MIHEGDVRGVKMEDEGEYQCQVAKDVNYLIFKLMTMLDKKNIFQLKLTLKKFLTLTNFHHFHQTSKICTICTMFVECFKPIISFLL